MSQEKKDPNQQAEREALDTLKLYKELCDLTAEAGAVDTVIGRPDALRQRLAELRDRVGRITSADIPRAALSAAPVAGQATAIEALLDENDRLRETLSALQDELANAEKTAPVAVPEGCSVADIGFRWDSEKQHHVPTLLIEFEPVPAGQPNTEKGWRDRDALAAMLSAAE